MQTVTQDVSIEMVEKIYDVLQPDQKEFVRNNYTVCTYRRNQIIYKEGETPDALLCLIEGKVKIYKEGVGGRGQIVRMVKVNSFFGYRALFAEEPYITSALAIEETTVIKIPRLVVFELLRSNNTLAITFIKSLSMDLGFSNTQTVSLTQKHIRGRLAEALLFLIETYGLEQDQATINIYLSREDLANLSNMTTSNAIRTLSNFSNEKLIAVDGRKIKILDEVNLRRISNLG